jgi:UTP--glucose-1-phosphate uridylyltransferase
METTSRFGIAECDQGWVVRLVEKPALGTTPSNLAIFGRYIVTEPVAAGLKAARAQGELELTFGFAAAIQTHAGVHAVQFDSDIYDCGTPVEYVASLARFAEQLGSPG